MNTSVNPAYEILHETALKAPSSSGVYLWRNEKGTVIYVGKAKNAPVERRQHERRRGAQHRELRFAGE